jgi:hypothetical protein
MVKVVDIAVKNSQGGEGRPCGGDGGINVEEKVLLLLLIKAFLSVSLLSPLILKSLTF